MRLTFKENNFFIYDSPKFLGEGWRPVGQRIFKTNELKEAVRFRKFADGRAENILKRHTLKTMPLPSDGFSSALDLLPFQEERGVPFILGQNNTYVAHQPGLGKSLQWITAVSSLGATGLMTCPNFLKINWAREIVKGCPDDFPEIEIIPESEKREETNWNARFLIVPDSMLSKSWVLEGILKHRKKDMLGIDEAHRFKTLDSNRTVALFGGRTSKVRSPGIIYDREYVTALSGTPMLNRPIELWPILYAMAPETINYRPMQDYAFRYCGAWQDERGHWHYNKSSNEEELSEKVMGKFIQYIKKSDVLEDLEDKIREVIPMDKDPRSKDVIAYDQELTKKLKLHKSELPKSLGGYAKLRHMNGLAKVKFAAEFVEFYLLNDLQESIILFAHHRDVVSLLANALKAFLPMTINGGIKDEERIRIEDAFQKGKRRLIIGNISAMNLGLTLTRASRVVFAEYDWTPKNNEQAEDRAHRIGQKDSVFAQYLVLPNSLDERMLLRLLEKEETIERIIK